MLMHIQYKSTSPIKAVIAQRLSYLVPKALAPALLCDPIELTLSPLHLIALWSPSNAQTQDENVQHGPRASRRESV